jgi:hypothetical protein
MSKNENELEITGQAFLNEVQEHIDAGEIDAAQTLIKAASVGLSMADDADGDLREAFGMSLVKLLGKTLNDS